MRKIKLNNLFKLPLLCLLGAASVSAAGLDSFYVKSIVTTDFPCGSGQSIACSPAILVRSRDENGGVIVYGLISTSESNAKNDLIRYRLIENAKLSFERIIDISKGASQGGYSTLASIQDGRLILSSDFNQLNKNTGWMLIGAPDKQNHFTEVVMGTGPQRRVLNFSPVSNGPKQKLATTKSLNNSDCTPALPGAIAAPFYVDWISNLTNIDQLHQKYNEKIAILNGEEFKFYTQGEINCAHETQISKFEKQNEVVQTLKLEKPATVNTMLGKLPDQPASIRALLQATLSQYAKQQINYFKISGMAEFGNDKLLLAIQEYGQSVSEKNSSVLFVVVHYFERDGIIFINSEIPFKVAADISSFLTNAVGGAVGVSQIHYSAENNKLYFLTTNTTTKTTETSKDYLWSLDVKADYSINPQSIRAAKFIDNSSARFQGQVSAFTFIDKDTFIVAHLIARRKTGDSVESNISKELSTSYSIFKLAAYPRVKF